MRNIPLLAIDTGYSAVKYAYKDGEGLKEGKFPSAIARFYFSKSKFGGKEPISYKGQKFYVGEEALKYSNYVMSAKHEGFSVVAAPLLMYHIYEREGIKPQAVCLSIAINEFGKEIEFRDFIEQKDVKGIKEELLIEKASSFEINGQKFFQKVLVLPQGVGIWFDQGQPKECVIVDIGRKTIDVVVVVDGQIDDSLTTGYTDRGSITILQLIADEIRYEFDLELSLPEAEKVLETGKLQVRGKEKDVSELIESLKEQYALKTIIDVLESPTIKPLWRKHGNIIVAGGGAYFIPESVKKDYSMKIPEKPEFSNVRGFIKQLEIELGFDGGDSR